MGTLIVTYPAERDGEFPLEGKFLQARMLDRDCLLFAALAECRYHNQILARFLVEQRIPHHWEDVAWLVVDGPGVTVKGGGRFRLDPSRGSLLVWDQSSAYGRFDASLLAAQLAAAGPPWDGLALGVG